MKISLVLPIYNLEFNYVKRCINSILSQNYDVWECILIDDGSKDNFVYHQYYNTLLKDKRFKYFYKKNEGLAIARNYGFLKCEGDLIWFIDPDDYIEHKTSFFQIINIFKENSDIDFINFNYYEITNNGIEKKIKYRNEGVYKNEINQIFIDDFNSWRTVWRNVYKSTFLKKYSIFHQYKNVTFEDVYFDLLVKSNFNKVYISNMFLYYYDKTRNSSIVNNSLNKKKQYLQMKENILDAKKYLIKNNQYSSNFNFYILNYFVLFPLVFHLPFH